MVAIVAVDKNFGIGYDNELLYKIKDDMNFFKETTTGKIVVMGRKTFESIGEPLPNRTNIVLTSDKSFHHEGVIVFNTIYELLVKISEYKQDDVFLIGGSQLYHKLIHYCDKLLLTRIKKEEKKANKFFPNIDKMTNWKWCICIKDTEEIVIDLYENLDYNKDIF